MEFKNWKNRKTFISIGDIAKELDVELDYRGLSRKTVSFKEQLIYIELICNIVYLCDRFISNSALDPTRDFLLLKENLNILLNNINYEQRILEKEERVIICTKNTVVTSVVELFHDETSYDIIEYNHFLLKGDLEKKRKILLKLSDKYAGISNRIKQYDSSINDDLSCLLNNLNIRHNNIKGKYKKEYVVNMKKEELEEWYDETYELLLFTFQLKNRAPKIKELKEKL